jgi:Lrp/AsnC family transcriptional regulator for asnA, asnC and gidA
MDKIDKTVINELQRDADRRIFQLEKATQIPRSTIHNRIKKLKKEKTITKIKAVVDPIKLGLNICVMLHVVTSSRKGAHAVAHRISKLPNTEEVYLTAGMYDIIAKIRFRNNQELSDFIFDDKTGIKVWEGVERTESMICLETIKENGILE